MADDPATISADEQAILDQAAEITKRREDAQTAARIASDDDLRAVLASDSFKADEKKLIAINIAKNGLDLDLGYAVEMFRRLRAKYGVAA